MNTPAYLQKKIMTENQLSKIVIGCAIEIHRQLGPGLLENVYQECLAYSLHKAGVSVQKEVQVPVIFHDVKIGCGYRLDLLIENKLAVEIKSVSQLNDLHMAQVLTYLRVGGYKLGLLLNFNVVKMKDGCRRLINGNLDS